MNYKEIQVPSETVRTFYEDFKNEVEKYIGPIDEYLTKKREIHREFMQSEKERYQRYVAAGGKDTWRNPEYGYSYRGWVPNIYDNPARKAYAAAIKMLQAASLASHITMTEAQVIEMQNMQEKKDKLLQSYVDMSERTPKIPKSEFEDHELVKPAELPDKDAITFEELVFENVRRIETEESSGHFGGALCGLILLGILVGVLLKTCS